VETGLSVIQLRARIRDNLRIDRYLQQRFGAAFQPAEEEIARYYRAHEPEFTVGGACSVRPKPVTMPGPADSGADVVAHQGLDRWVARARK
jgi:hypothetical protein